VSPHDACAAFVHGYLARRDARRAEMVLDAWAADHPHSAPVAYMRGVYWQWLGDAAGDLLRRSECRDRAEKEFQRALAVEPRHEMARQALAELLEEDDRLEEALAQYAALAAECPASDTAKLGVARMLRGLGALDQARLALESLRPAPESSADAAAEQGQIDLESGDYEEAQKWFRQVDLDRTDDADALRAAATTFSLEGKTTGAERLFARLDGEHAGWVRTEELLTRLATGPLDPKAADELKRLSSPGAGRGASEPLGEDRPATSASDLYAQQCGGCHGNNGDGNGRGSRHLFPRARDFRTGKFRLVSSVNGVPTVDEVAEVIRRGMPGTSMKAYDKLSDDERVLLAREVLRLRREGIREQLINTMKAEGEEIDADEVDEQVEFCTTPGEAVSVPPIGPGDLQAVARGKDHYVTLGCNKCHGKDGTGAWDTPCYDERGDPSPPRDLVHDPFKGGPEPKSIYLRIFVGMPGTPHPACWNVPEDQLVDLVQYCRSLSREPKRVRTNHERAMEASRLALKDEG
jgi:tetratricopeptide (TPR) repeat protein